jgi:diguanylate cyclase
MLKELFINSTILISFLLLGSIALRNTNINMISLKHKLILGLVDGLLAIILMFFSIHISSDSFMDLRHIAIVISAFYGGLIPSIITGLIIFLFRLFFFGVNTPGIIAAVNMFITAIACGIIAKTISERQKKYILMTISCVIIISITFILNIKNVNLLMQTLALFWTGSLLIGYLTYFLSTYFEESITLLRRLKEESTKDFLTGLNNVRKFDDLINNAIENSKVKGERLSLLTIDIDFFKKINDTYGHPAGDAVLRELGIILSKNCRSFDEVSRVGGEEFSAILPDCPKDQALIIGERLRLAVEKHTFILPDGTKVNITVSIGASSYPDSLDNIDTIIKQADLALYRAKQSGRNKVCL